MQELQFRELELDMSACPSPEVNNSATNVGGLSCVGLGMDIVAQDLHHGRSTVLCAQHSCMFIGRELLAPLTGRRKLSAAMGVWKVRKS
jgi:hypothetical protein